MDKIYGEVTVSNKKLLELFAATLKTLCNAEKVTGPIEDFCSYNNIKLVSTDPKTFPLIYPTLNKNADISVKYVGKLLGFNEEETDYIHTMYWEYMADEPDEKIFEELSYFFLLPKEELRNRMDEFRKNIESAPKYF